MEWIELIVHTTTEGSDQVSGVLMDCGASGTMIEDRADIPDPDQPHGIWEIIDPALLESMPPDVLVHAWFEESPALPSLLDSVQSKLKELLSVQSESVNYGTLQLDTRSVNDQAWTDIWKKYFKPFHAGTHLVIKPTWEPFIPDAEDLVIEIDPGMAFGSGTHETTGMCLSLLESNIHGGEDVIDVGQTVCVQQGNLLDRVSEVCDICVANIISDVIISFATPLMKHIRPGGLFICSGIVSQRSDEVALALSAAGYEILQKVTRGEWTAFLSRRNN